VKVVDDEEDIFHKDPKTLDDLHFDIKFVDTFDIISNVPIISNLHKDQVISFEIIDNNEQIDRLASDIFISTEDDEGNLQLPDFQTKKYFSIYEEGDGVLESSDQ
jgi:hypothetical protein